jgi:hypothetical protein
VKRVDKFCGREVSEEKMWVHTDHTPVFMHVLLLLQRFNVG